MIAILAAIVLILLGTVVRSELLVIFGFIAIALQLTLDTLKSRAPAPVAQARPRPRHKLVEAPDDMWEKQEDNVWQAMMSGPSPMSIGGQPDFMNIATRGVQNPHVAGVMRGMLPFQNYGRQGPMGALENVFIGFPIGIGNFFRG
ncbi:MAG: hypothetical protein KAW41_04375 [Candidatus Diapherotrites archaeon]|nr:hypothetical protein [Candidatus Diapherotrites archaeon]